ncbi:unnamed protein product, partial [marine sediment metagenome]
PLVRIKTVVKLFMSQITVKRVPMVRAYLS